MVSPSIHSLSNCNRGGRSVEGGESVCVIRWCVRGGIQKVTTIGHVHRACQEGVSRGHVKRVCHKLNTPSSTPTRIE